MPVRLHVAQAFPANRDHVRFVRTFAGSDSGQRMLFKRLPPGYGFHSLKFVDDIEDADYVLIPYALRTVTSEWSQLFARLQNQAAGAGKEIILFIGGDLSHTVHVHERCIVFKPSEYRHARRNNEIIFAPFVSDLSEEMPCEPRAKRAGKPVVGFCGYAGFPSVLTYGKYLLKNAMLDVASLWNPLAPVYKRGIYFRRKAIAALERSERVETKFIVRSSYGGNSETTRISPEAARREYLENMRDSDFVLAPKGDANFSSRFYEALSLGRIPILIDTDMILPLEHIVDYSEFIIRVPYSDIDRLGDIVADFYHSLSDEKFRAMQERAREAYVKYLRYDSYFNIALPLLKEKGLEALR